ncbi:hypothetical protein HDU92_004136 [Lobulomyces angularis]|nr:hypothetical protein HDU92_004136 [Lobulomyces angularis]
MSNIEIDRKNLTISTPLSRYLKMKNPIWQAGMFAAAGSDLCAAVSNAGGLGCIGGLGFTPDLLRKQVKAIKKNLNDPNLPFGIDLALPQVGGSARKTNYDYTNGQLPELIDVVVESGAKLFVSAIGVPPPWAVKKLHDNNILIMNMIGSVKHIKKAIEAGCDIMCCQGSEGGGHTGSITTSILIPAAVDECKGFKSRLTGEPIYVVAAGGIYDGRARYLMHLNFKFSKT